MLRPMGGGGGHESIPDPIRRSGLGCWAAPAAGAATADLGGKVTGHPSLTYFDLMKLAVPDLTPDGEGHKLVPFTHIQGKDSRVDPEDSFSVAAVEVMTIPGDANRIILLADLGRSEGNVANANLMALFQLGPKPRLLNAVESNT